MKCSREGKEFEVDRYNEEIPPLYGGYSDFYGGNWPLAVLILCAKASGRIPSVLLQPYGQSSSWPLPADASARVAGWRLCSI